MFPQRNMMIDRAISVKIKAGDQLLICSSVNALVLLFTISTMLFSILSPGVLNLIDWHYLGGGPEFQKIHVATYLLIATFLCLWLIDPYFRGNVTELFFNNWDLTSFVLAVGAVSTYAVLVKHVSVSPFVDTFLAALLVTIGWMCLPTKNLRRLRYLLDLYFVINISILFIEYSTRSWLIALPYPGPFRAIGFFENPLSAATLLGVYAIANFASMPVKFTRQCLARLTLGFTSLLAIFTTGGRSSLVVSGLLLIAFVTLSGVRQIASGRVNRAA